MYYASRIAGVSALLAVAAAAAFSIRLAWADTEFRRGTPEAVARAVALAPRNTAYLSFQALQTEYAGGDPRPILERIAALNPLSSAPRIRLGLDAEVRGDYAAAERWLLDAARVDHQFEPRWTLANFYFRRERRPEFWTWIRAALEVSYGDRRPAFDLCWQVSQGPKEIESAIPERREVLAAYLSYLLEKRHVNAVAAEAERLARWRDPADRALLYSVCDALLDADDGSAARGVWIAMGFAAPAGIVSPDFDAPRIGHGFDWRLVESPGVTHLAVDSPPAHRILFNGSQPEACELLRQFVGLRAGRRYTLRWETHTSGFAARTGLEWRIAGQSFPVAASKDWAAAQATLTTIQNESVLSLDYQRPSGETRAEGWLEVRHVTITESPR